jgi:hypothetical protein
VAPCPAGLPSFQSEVWVLVVAVLRHALAAGEVVLVEHVRARRVWRKGAMSELQNVF